MALLPSPVALVIRLHPMLTAVSAVAADVRCASIPASVCSASRGSSSPVGHDHLRDATALQKQRNHPVCAGTQKLLRRGPTSCRAPCLLPPGRDSAPAAGTPCFWPRPSRHGLLHRSPMARRTLSRRAALTTTRSMAIGRLHHRYVRTGSDERAAFCAKAAPCLRWSPTSLTRFSYREDAQRLARRCSGDHVHLAAPNPLHRLGLPLAREAYIRALPGHAR